MNTVSKESSKPVAQQKMKIIDMVYIALLRRSSPSARGFPFQPQCRSHFRHLPSVSQRVCWE